MPKVRTRQIFFADPGPTSKETATAVTEFPHALALPAGPDDPLLPAFREALLTRVVLPARWEAGDRVTTTGSRFAWADCLYVDVDDGRLTLADLAARLAGVEHVVYTSTNHLREKNGVTCERFKVLFPLARRVYQLDAFTRLLRKLVAALGSDPAGSLPKQKYFPPYAPDPVFAYRPGPTDVATWLRAHQPRVQKGERNAWLFREACRLAITGLAEDDVFARLRELRDEKVEDPDDRELGDPVLRDMARRAAAKFDGSAYQETFRAYEARYVKVADPLGIFDLAKGKLLPLDNNKRFYENVPHNFVTLDDGKTLNVWAVWLRLSARCAEALEFAPDQAPLAVRVVTHRGHPVTTLNTFTGMVAPAPGGSCDLYLAFVRDVVCAGDETVYRWLVTYLAYIYQRPADHERRHCYAVALSGPQGTGKNTFVDLFGRLFNEAYADVTDVEAVLSFNGELASKLVVLFDEAFSAAWKNTRRVLKSIITSRWLTVNEKFVPKYRLANYARYFFATNDDHSAPVEVGDRRYVCLELAAARKEDQAYFGAIYREAAAGGTAALARYLQAYPVDDAVLAARPKTAKWRDNMERALQERGAVYSFLHDLVEADDPVVPDVGTGFWALLAENGGYVPKRLLAEEVNRHARASGLPAVTVRTVAWCLERQFPSLIRGEARVGAGREHAFYLGDRARVEDALRELLR